MSRRTKEITGSDTTLSIKATPIFCHLIDDFSDTYVIFLLQNVVGNKHAFQKLTAVNIGYCCCTYTFNILLSLNPARKFTNWATKAKIKTCILFLKSEKNAYIPKMLNNMLLGLNIFNTTILTTVLEKHLQHYGYKWVLNFTTACLFASYRGSNYILCFINVLKS